MLTFLNISRDPEMLPNPSSTTDFWLNVIVIIITFCNFTGRQYHSIFAISLLTPTQTLLIFSPTSQNIADRTMAQNICVPSGTNIAESTVSFA